MMNKLVEAVCVSKATNEKLKTIRDAVIITGILLLGSINDINI